MKFRLTFKTPDVLDDALAGAEEERNEMIACAKKWIRYGELLTVEFDTTERTATVIGVS